MIFNFFKRKVKKAKQPLPRQDFEKEVLAHLDGMFGLAFQLTRHKANAEDLVQDTVVKAIRASEQFESGTNIKAWLFTILRNTFINAYRKNKRAPTENPQEENPDFTFYGEAMKQYQSTQDEAAGAELRDPEKLEHFLGDEVMNALGELSDDFREVIFLCDVQELSYQDIASILQVPVGTVRSRLARARGALQKKLWDYAQKRGLIRSAKS